METIKGHFFRDSEKELLWLHTYEYDQEFVVNTNFGKVDLATCEQVDAEIVSVHHFFISNSSAELLIAKDVNENYAALTILMDSVGFGGVYASITPGFSFRSIHGFVDDCDIYIIGEDLEGNWGVIRISACYSYWGELGLFSPNIIVDFKYKSMQEALEWCRIAREAANEDKLTDFIKPTELIAHCINDGELDWGITLQEIKLRKGSENF